MGIQQKTRWEVAIATSLSDVNGSCWTSRDYQLSHNVWYQMSREPQINNDVLYKMTGLCGLCINVALRSEVRFLVSSFASNRLHVCLESCMPPSVNPVCQSFVYLCSPVCGPCVLVCAWLLTGVFSPSSLYPTESVLSASIASQPPVPTLSWHSELRRHNALLWWWGRKLDAG